MKGNLNLKFKIKKSKHGIYSFNIDTTIANILALGLLGTKLKPTTAGCLGTLSLAICALLAYMTAWQYFSMPG